ncbi:hypothetical protein [Chitinophaga sp. sic0106]|uniref:hypothetical protein n=1 Tax=Chitinophaga sp. sic0106 TaxID=2854785 RepID=UPI001C4711F3|nr:hypothetical protein [Chitinophaga sp. sic0106]MBV7531803.1 hypothetical protein [Chitinophaga sp. sic0106]
MKKYLFTLIILSVQLCSAQDTKPIYANYLNRTNWVPMDICKDGKTHVYSVKLSYENGHLLQPAIFSKNSNDLFKKFIETHYPDLDTFPWYKFIPSVKDRKQFTVWWVHLYAAAHHDYMTNPFSPTELIKDMSLVFDVISKENEEVFIAPPFLIQMYSAK